MEHNPVLKETNVLTIGTKCMVFKEYHNQIKELRKAIRLSVYHKTLYGQCLDSFKEHTSIIKKAETKLRKVGSGKDETLPNNLAHLFSDWIDSKNIKSQKRKQDLVKTKLMQMSSTEIHAFLNDRVDSLWEEKRLFKGLLTQEKRAIERLENELRATDDPKASSVIPFIISVENLTIDQEETENIYSLGSNALGKLKTSIKSLSSIAETPISQIENNSNEGQIAYNAFFTSVQAYMYLCAFKNELSQYADNRDLQLHLDSLKDFMTSFINYLVLDWTEHDKIRQSLLYLRKTENITEALLKGLNSKITKIKSELSLTSQELNAILTRMDLN